MVWFTLALLVGTFLLQELLRPKPKIENARPAGLGDFRFPTATEDRVVPLIFGRVLVDGPNVIWYGAFEQEEITKKVKTSLFSSKKQVVGHRYRFGMQLGLCRGPDVQLVGLRIGKREVWSGLQAGEGRIDIDEPELFGGDELGAGGVQASVDFYPGTDTQSVSPFLNTPGRQQIATAATPTAPRYTGTSHLLIRELTSATATASDRGAYVGNSTSIEPWAAELQRFPVLIAGQNAGDHIMSGTDCNPVNIIYEHLTNTEWGLGRDPSTVDVGSGSTFQKASQTLRTEGNGFAIAIANPLEAGEFVEEILRQIDGTVYFDHAAGKWKIHLVRAATDANWGWDIDLVPQITTSTAKDVEELQPGSWGSSTNQLQVRFTKRADEYKTSFARAQNPANAIMLAGGTIGSPVTIPAVVDYPGVKDPALANDIAWRDLRAMARPLKRATFKNQRNVYGLHPGAVVAWTDPSKGYVKLPMRVQSLDLGTAESGTITLKCIEDVFRYIAGSGGAPPPTQWTPPVVALQAFPSDEQVAFEAPRALVVRDPDYQGDPDVAKIYAAARRQGTELGFEILERHHATTPSGPFADAGSVVQFVRIGQLASSLAVGSPIPLTTLTISPGPDSQAVIEQVFVDASSLADLGGELMHLLLVGEEFMLARTSGTSGGDVTLNDVYRGVLDSVQSSHSAGAPVYLLFVGGGITDATFTPTDAVDVELRMRSRTEVYSGAVTTIALDLNKRSRRPYPPAAVRYNGALTLWGSPSLEANGSGLNGAGFDIDLRRRRFDTTNELDELLQDNAVSASTEHRVRIFVEPAGANVLAYDSGWFTGASVTPRPTQAELIVPAPAGTEIRVRVDSRHNHNAEVELESYHALEHDTTPSSPRTAQFYLGGNITPSTASNAYTTAATGTFSLTIGGAYASSAVQARINGGAWSTIIAAGNTTGTIPGVTSGDTLEVQHTVSQGPDPNFVEIRDPGNQPVAYGAFSA